MNKFVAMIGLNTELIKGEVVSTLEKYRTIIGPLDEECGYDLVEIYLSKEEMPIIEDQDGKKFIGFKVEEDNFISAWCPIN